MDPDLRAYRNERALASARERSIQENRRGVPKSRLRNVDSVSGTLPTFDLHDEVEEGDEDPELAITIQRSLDSKSTHEFNADDEMNINRLPV